MYMFVTNMISSLEGGLAATPTSRRTSNRSRVPYMRAVGMRSSFDNCTRYFVHRKVIFTEHISLVQDKGSNFKRNLVINSFNENGSCTYMYVLHNIYVINTTVTILKYHVQ